MQANEYLRQDNMLILKLGHASQVNLGKLPKSSYFYRFFIYNPSGATGILKVIAAGKDRKAKEGIVKFKGIVTEYRYNFDTIDPFGSCHINFLLEKNETVFLRLPVSPVIIQEVDEQQPFLFGLDEDILSRIDEADAEGFQKLVGRKKSPDPSNRPGMSVINTKEIESFINARYFKGFLSLSEAERQLDHVVFHKMFNPDGAKGFARFKKRFFRRVLKAVYRLLTRNRSRKLYFAKLYCNYINGGVLAENSQN